MLKQKVEKSHASLNELKLDKTHFEYHFQIGIAPTH